MVRHENIHVRQRSREDEQQPLVRVYSPRSLPKSSPKKTAKKGAEVARALPKDNKKTAAAKEKRLVQEIQASLIPPRPTQRQQQQRQAPPSLPSSTPTRKLPVQACGLPLVPSVSSSTSSSSHKSEEESEEEEEATVMPVVADASLLRKASLTEHVDQFRVRFKAGTADCIKNAYGVYREVYYSQTGSASTSIAEDIMALLWMQNDVLTEYVTLNQDCAEELVTDVYRHVFHEIKATQSTLFLMFLGTKVDCCAAANDFFRLSNKLEVFCDTLIQDFEFPHEVVKQDGMDLVAKLNQDAVSAAEYVQVFFVRELNQTDIPTNFFSVPWENDWTHNEVMVDLLQHLDEMLPNAERLLDNEMLYGKVLTSACRAIVGFYIRCLVEKADALCRRKRGRRRGSRATPFNSSRRALLRMQDDIKMLGQFFKEQTSRSNVALTRIVVNELRLLEVVYECLASASDEATYDDTLDTMIVVLHKRTGADSLVTRYFVGDLWSLVTENQHNQKYKPGRGLGRSHINNKRDYLHGVMAKLEPDLEMVSKGMKETKSGRVSKRKGLNFLRVDEMLRSIYEDRIAQGLLPLCWTCLPKAENAEGSRTVVTEQVRRLTRKVMELPLSVSPPKSRRSSPLKIREASSPIKIRPTTPIKNRPSAPTKSRQPTSPARSRDSALKVKSPRSPR